VRKLRRFHSSADLRKIYDHTYNSGQWPEHVRRVAFTRDLIQELVSEHGLTSLADLSSGDAEVTKSVRGLDSRHYRDYSDHGEDILSLLNGLLQPVDLFVCTETIEHLEAPWTVIEKIREKTKWLVLSCPNGEKNTENWEHYWSFTQNDVLDMLTQAGFTETKCHGLWEPGWNYDYQIWTAR
jgi:hypothetical protein